MRTTITVGLAGRVAQALRGGLTDPRYRAQKLIREHLDGPGPFLGEGTPECPWLVFSRGADFFAFYVRGRELVNPVAGGRERIVCVL